MITDEQRKVIRMIEDNLDIKFTGETKLEAQKFIRSNMDESKKVSDRYKQLLLENYGGYKKIWTLLSGQSV